MNIFQMLNETAQAASAEQTAAQPQAVQPVAMPMPMPTTTPTPAPAANPQIDQLAAVFGNLGDIKITKLKYQQVGEIYGFSAAQLQYITRCVVVQGDWGKSLMCVLNGIGAFYIQLGNDANYPVGTVIEPKNVRLKTLVKEDEIDPAKRTIVRVC